MREVSVTLYEFNELTPVAQEFAKEAFLYENQFSIYEWVQKDLIKWLDEQHDISCDNVYWDDYNIWIGEGYYSLPLKAIGRVLSEEEYDFLCYYRNDIKIFPIEICYEEESDVSDNWIEKIEYKITNQEELGEEVVNQIHFLMEQAQEWLNRDLDDLIHELKSEWEIKEKYYYNDIPNMITDNNFEFLESGERWEM